MNGSRVKAIKKELLASGVKELTSKIVRRAKNDYKAKVSANRKKK